MDIKDQTLISALDALGLDSVEALDNWLHKMRGGLVAPHGYLQLVLAGKYGEVSPDMKQALDKAKVALDDMVAKIGAYQELVRDSSDVSHS